MLYEVTIHEYGEDVMKVGAYPTRQEAVEEAISFCGREYGYCLDSDSDRRETLTRQDFCILGCGPRKVRIDEVE